MSVAWYSGIDDSGAQGFWDQYKSWLQNNAPGPGKYYRQMMKDPTNSSLATASLASTARAQKLAQQNYTVDPEIAAHPDLLAARMNKQNQDIASEGSTNFMNALAQQQAQLYGANLQRRLSIYGTQAQAGLDNLHERDRMMQGRQRTSGFMKALSIASPFLSLIPGVGPALAAGTSAVASAAG